MLRAERLDRVSLAQSRGGFAPASPRSAIHAAMVLASRSPRRMSALLAACLVQLPVPLASGRSETTTLVLESVADTTLFEEGELSNGAGSHLFAGVTGKGTRRRALLRFDLAAIPASSRIVSVQLRLFMSKTSSGPQPMMLRRLEAAWGEGASNSDTQGGGGGVGAPAEPGDATWLWRLLPDAQWNLPGGDFLGTPSAAVAVDGNGFYVWGPTDALIEDVAGWIDAPATNAGWILMGAESSPFTAKRFDSREFPLPDRRPTLTIVFAPASVCVGDLDGDGIVSAPDLALLLGAWSSAGVDADLDGSGLVDAADLALLLGAWGRCPSDE